MKLIAGIFIGLLTIIQTTLPIKESSRDVEITAVEATSTMDFVNEKTTLVMELTIRNGYHHDIKETTLVLDTYLEGVFQKRVTLLIKDDIRHFHTQEVKVTQVYDEVYFDEIDIISINTLEKTFFQTYQLIISSALFYNFILFFMWSVFNRHQNYILSEIKDVLIYQWWYFLVCVLVIPVVVNILGLVGRFQFMDTVYGWIYFLSVLITFPAYYGLLMLYHYVKER
ncbi:hypothetical protein N7603_06795 [Acholeplasma vituli]|uniref:Uncharacterized protein n=1 Tax=Paracholeplasma vituli TaxID=69473 RepID=A0ABT2PWN0_9MOLU|nr:hypothetical protein [Paracholeplasma vituli]MCU0105360.1 hypothetical protein [Paracholeplasma vituli]